MCRVLRILYRQSVFLTREEGRGVEPACALLLHAWLPILHIKCEGFVKLRGNLSKDRGRWQVSASPSSQDHLNVFRATRLLLIDGEKSKQASEKLALLGQTRNNRTLDLQLPSRLNEGYGQTALAARAWKSVLDQRLCSDFCGRLGSEVGLRVGHPPACRRLYTSTRVPQATMETRLFRCCMHYDMLPFLLACLLACYNLAPLS